VGPKIWSIGSYQQESHREEKRRRREEKEEGREGDPYKGMWAALGAPRVESLT